MSEQYPQTARQNVSEKPDHSEQADFSWMPIGIDTLTAWVRTTSDTYNAVPINAEATKDEVQYELFQTRAAAQRDIEKARLQFERYEAQMATFIKAETVKAETSNAEIDDKVASADTLNKSFTATGNKLTGELKTYKELLDEKKHLEETELEKVDTLAQKRLDQTVKYKECTEMDVKLQTATHGATIATEEMQAVSYRPRNPDDLSLIVYGVAPFEDNKNRALGRKETVFAKYEKVQLEFGKLSKNIFDLESDLSVIRTQSIPTIIEQIKVSRAKIMALYEELTEKSAEMAEIAEILKPLKPRESASIGDSLQNTVPKSIGDETEETILVVEVPKNQPEPKSPEPVSNAQSNLGPRILDLIPEDAFQVSASERFFGRGERMRINKISNGSN